MNKGRLSLMQILISIFLFASFTLVTLKILKQQAHLTESSSYAIESLSIIDKMKTLLSKPLSCTSSLKGMNPRFSKIEDLYFQKNKKKVSFKKIGLKELIDINNNIDIKSMTLDGQNDPFSIKNGYTLLNVKFVDKSSRDKRFKVYSFPIHIKLDNSSMISSCYSLEGLEAHKEDNDIGKWELKENQVIQIKTKSLIVGQADIKGELNIKGGLRLGLEYEDCNQRNYGSLRYDRKQGLVFCNRRESWEKVHQQNSIDLSKESFSVKSKDLNKEKFKITQKSYAFCQLDKSLFSSGKCFTEPMNVNENKTQWKLAVYLRKGIEMTCRFSCYN